MRQNCKGMTLLELLIAVAVFAIMAALAHGGLNVVLQSSRTANDEAERLANVQRVFARLGADIEQMAGRSVRGAYGDYLAALQVEHDGASGAHIEFTRHGRQNPAGRARSSLQRVAYQLSEKMLIRESWAVLDRAQDSVAYDAEMLENVSGFEVRFMDKEGNVTEDWQTDSQDAVSLPYIVEVTIELEDWGKITRLYRVAA